MNKRIFSGMWWRAGAPQGDSQVWWPEHSGFWFRVFGYGLLVSTQPRSEALFSERYGYTKALYVFGLRIKVLKP